MSEKLIRAIRVLEPNEGDVLVVQVDEVLPEQQIADALEDALRTKNTGKINIVVVPSYMDIQQLDEETLNRAGYFKKKDK